VKQSASGRGRRLLVRQEYTNDLVVSEWTENIVTHHRIKERVASSAAKPKPGTPLALQVDTTGLLHLFYLSQTNLISHIYETEAGKWKSGEVTDERGSIRTSSSSSLSTARHKGTGTPDLLILAYDDASQKLQLAIADNPADRNAWYLAEVTSVAVESVPGQSNVPCYSLAGDMESSGGEDGGQKLLIGVLEKDEVVAWECAIDFWPPPDIQVKCGKSNTTLAGEYSPSDGTAALPIH
jgi:hypothetical protein